MDFGTPAVSHGFDELCVPSRSRDLYRGNCLLAGGADLFNTKIPMVGISARPPKQHRVQRAFIRRRRGG